MYKIIYYSKDLEHSIPYYFYGITLDENPFIGNSGYVAVYQNVILDWCISIDQFDYKILNKRFKLLCEKYPQYEDELLRLLC